MANNLPIADFTYTPTNPGTSTVVTFTDTSTDSDGTIVSRDWRFNNNGLWDGGGASPTTHVFTVEGNYFCGLRVVDNEGGVDTVGKLLLVSNSAPPNEPPVASFSRSPTNPIVGETVTFTDTSVDPDGSIASRAWDLDNDALFDDGTGVTANTTFSTTGSKTVGLRVTDNDGDTGTAFMTFTVTAAPPPPPAGTLLGPTSVAAQGSVNQIVVVADLPRDDLRTRTRIMSRATARLTIDPTGLPVATTRYDSTGGTAVGQTTVGATKQAVALNDLILLSMVTPTAGTFEVFVYLDPSGGGAGTTNMRAIAYASSGGAPDGQAQLALGNQFSFTNLTVEGWKSLGFLSLPAGTIWVGYIAGGQGGIVRRSRQAGAEKFATDLYSSPSAVCPETSDATLRTSLYVLTAPGGGPLGGRIQFSFAATVGNHFVTAYTENATTSKLLDATPSPAVATAPVNFAAGLSLVTEPFTYADGALATVGSVRWSGSLWTTDPSLQVLSNQVIASTGPTMPFFVLYPDTLLFPDSSLPPE